MIRAASAITLTILPGAILLLPADMRFVDFDDAHEPLKIRIAHRRAKPHAHIPSCLVRAGADKPIYLSCTDTFLGGEQQMQHLEPNAERLLGFLENGPSLEREAIGERGLARA